MRAIGLALLLLLAGQPATAISGRRLAKQVNTLIRSTPAARQAAWGIEVRSRGKALYALNAGRLLTPASNVKLLTTALALTRLGPGFRVTTQVVRSSADLVLLGAGDANLSGRALPYRPQSPPGDPLAAMRDLAAQAAASGIREVRDVIGDDTAFEYEPYPGSWALEDTVDDDGPPVSALSLDDNVLTLRVTPGAKPGDPVTAALDPPLPVFDIQNRAVTGPGPWRWFREPGTNVLELTGAVEPGAVPAESALSAGDPARFAALALIAALREKGITVSGGARVRHYRSGDPAPAPWPGPAVATRISGPLLEDIQLTNKISQNLHAEILLRLVARQTDGQGRLKTGLDALSGFLAGLGIDRDDFELYDGSGLSRMDLVTPHALVLLLDAMNRGPFSEAWRSLLPVGGEDGSLRLRFPTKPGRVLAKTGSLTHVAALSGYARGKKDELVFSIFVNNFRGPAAEARGIIDRIVLSMLE